jgi:hypothetical protein
MLLLKMHNLPFFAKKVLEKQNLFHFSIINQSFDFDQFVLTLIISFFFFDNKIKKVILK